MDSALSKCWDKDSIISQLRGTAWADSIESFCNIEDVIESVAVWEQPLGTK